MDGETLRTDLEAAYADALDRLGSSDLIVALSGGDPDPDALLRAAADSEHAARETFREWARTAVDDDGRERYAAVARQEDEHLRRVSARIVDGYQPADGGPMHAYLRGRDHPIDRVAGGMVGRTLVSLRTHARLIAFFEGRDATDGKWRDATDGSGASSTADLFRDLRAETAACLDDGLAALDRRCGEDDWDRARLVAGYVIRVADDDLCAALAAAGDDSDDR